MNHEACEVPLFEQLRRVHRDHRLKINRSPIDCTIIPIGELCHKAADKLEVMSLKERYTSDHMCVCGYSYGEHSKGDSFCPILESVYGYKCERTKFKWNGCMKEKTKKSIKNTPQETNCAMCGELKETPLRLDFLGGYVCLSCIDNYITMNHNMNEITEENTVKAIKFFEDEIEYQKEKVMELETSLADITEENREMCKKIETMSSRKFNTIVKEETRVNKCSSCCEFRRRKDVDCDSNINWLYCKGPFATEEFIPAELRVNKANWECDRCSCVDNPWYHAHCDICGNPKAKLIKSIEKDDSELVKEFEAKYGKLAFLKTCISTVNEILVKNGLT